MKKWIVPTLLLAALCVQAQTSSDTKRLRISAEKARLEAAFALEDTACYPVFWVNSCLDEVTARRRNALADLRRQEVALNDEARKAKAAEQLKKTEDKLAPEKLQQEAEKRAQASKKVKEKMLRDKQKKTDHETLHTEEQAKSAAAQALEKYNARQAKAKERQARYARDKVLQPAASAKPLPAP